MFCTCEEISENVEPESRMTIIEKSSRVATAVIRSSCKNIKKTAFSHIVIILIIMMPADNADAYC